MSNTREPGYSTQLLSDFLLMRNNLIKQLVGSSLKNFKVLDACCTTTCPSTANTVTRLAKLKRFTAKDGVHYITAGYKNLADRITATLKTLLSSPRRPNKPQSRVWRGFKSPVGSAVPQVNRQTAAQSQGGSLQCSWPGKGPVSWLRISPLSKKIKLYSYI